MSGQLIDLKYAYQAATTSNIAEYRLPDAFPLLSSLPTQTFGSTTNIPSIAVDSKGRVIQASNITSLDASVLNTGTLPNAVLPNVGTATTVGSSNTGFPVITTDTKGRVLTATTATVDTSIITSGVLPVARGGTGTTATIGTGSIVFNSNATLSNTTFIGNVSFPNKAINTAALADMGGGLVASQYGSATAVPVINVNSAGLITSISTAPVPTQANTGFLASGNSTTTNCNLSVNSNATFNSNTTFNSTVNFNFNTAFYSNATFNSNTTFNAPTIYNSNASYIGLLAANNINATTLSYNNAYGSNITSSNATFSNATILNATISNVIASNVTIIDITTSNIHLSNLNISTFTTSNLSASNLTITSLLSYYNLLGSNNTAINATFSNAAVSNLNVNTFSYSNATGSNLTILKLNTSNINASNLTIPTGGVISFPTGSIPASALSNSGVTQGSYGATLTVPSITVNSQGIITNIYNNTPIPLSGFTITNATSNTTNCNVVLSSNLAVLANTTLSNTTVTGTLSLPNQSISSASLVNTGVTPGTYIAATVTVNSAGQITVASANSIVNSGFSVSTGNTTVTNCNVLINSNLTAYNLTASNLTAPYLTSSNLNASNINVAYLYTSNLSVSSLSTSNLNVTANINASNINTTSDTTIGGALTVNGATTLNAQTTMGAINVTGTAVMSGTLSVTGQTTVNNLTVNGTSITLPSKAINPTALADSLANPGTYGATTSIPLLTVNSTGLITGISTATVQIPGFTQTGNNISTNSNVIFNSN
ncbi:MAG: hypothetical protein EBU08_13535, partial [Micrococcales bacterium]|nr:hypothetical protein [Micrococcales bacterium]